MCCVDQLKPQDEADLVARGGKRKFAADANVRTDCRKADARFTCRDVVSTNVGCADEVEPHSYLTGVLTVIVNGHKQKHIDQLLPWNFKV